MFSLFFAGIQQDFKLMLFAPLLSAAFRLIFIEVYGTEKSPAGHWRKWKECFRYGFWWGLDWHAYVFLFSMVLVSLPGAFLPAYYAVGDTVRLIGGMVYAFVLYTAFIGRMVFYHHFHDNFNETLWLGRKAEKHNFVDIFFHEDHGALVLLSFVPAMALCFAGYRLLLSIPQVTYPELATGALQWAINAVVFIAAVLLFYWLRFGGTLKHRDKPEWDEIPAIVKKDVFMARATVDDLVALEMVWQHPLASLLSHTDEEDAAAIDRIVPAAAQGKWQSLPSPADAFVRHAKGARIAKPRHIFLIVGESYSQMPLDEVYADYHIMDGAKKLRAEAHTASLSNFLPAGMVSRPAIVSLMTGIFDARLELNEREDFWRGGLDVTLPRQLAKLGYQSIYWYGGNPTYGNFDKYGPAAGFDKVMGATEFCPPDAPRTWVGVYDHIFLEHAAELIENIGDTPMFHFVYTTSNHGPYQIPLETTGFDTEAVMPDVPEAVKKSEKLQKMLGTFWYSDRAITTFIERMRNAYPDSLFVVTGDHAHIPLHPGDTLARKELTLREQFCTSFMMLHPGIDQSILSGNTIGSHMNIAPTIYELIAPAGFEYYAYFQPLTEHVDHVVTPYHWLDENAIGPSGDRRWQPLTVTAEPLPMQEDEGSVRYAAEREALEDVTGWIARHPEACLQKW